MDDDLAVLGIAVPEQAKWAGEDDEAEDFEIYAENAQSVSVFTSMATQWQWTGGMESHRSGLNHAVLFMHMDKVGVSRKRKRRFEVMADVQVMERAALDVWHEAAAARQEEQRRKAGK
ncbi:DUF1799 domain-containing protein [Massilia forsythiae]|uniref:DUF1799 domain-containing protein n=1 Tax=Massilia forsythiae TaxID=2728020 RepID=A0A7Z2ZUU3_9BURK|nr:DUF1799 domain-containing protein [Massilia forsythiae]QJE03041.1 DUF1799 domain-containing protein [Massilia forsythiae]